MAELTLEMKFLTDVGRKRRHNEDFVDFYEPADPEELARSGRLYIVADGVGGGADGEVASEYAVNKVLHEYYRSTEADLGERLQAAIGAANADIFEHVEQRPELGQMGTTIVAAVVRGDELVVANVGDSRAYLIRNGGIHQITRDHSLVAKLVEEGSITPEEAEHHPKKNVVLRSIGADPDVYPDIFEGRLQPGDQIVLCSDGLTRHVSDNEILNVTTRTPVNRAVRQLVDMANARGGKDNISVMHLRATEAVPLSTVAETIAGQRALVPPEFGTIHDIVHKRRTVSPLSRRSATPAWLALAGALAVVLIVGALLVTTLMTRKGGTEADATALASLLTTTQTEAAPAAATARPSATPTSASQPSPAPTKVTSQSPHHFAVVAMSYTMPQGGTLAWIAELWGGAWQWECISKTNDISDPSLVGIGQRLTIPGRCLTSDEAPVGQIVFSSGLPEMTTSLVLNIRNGRIDSYDHELREHNWTRDIQTARVVRSEQRDDDSSLDLTIGATGAPGTPWNPTSDEDELQPVWSPDGEWIAFIRAKPDRIIGQDFGDLWIGHAEGSELHQLTRGYCVADPFWSPNGNYIAFTARCEVTVSEGQQQDWSRASEPADIGVVPCPWVVPKEEGPTDQEYLGYMVLLTGPDWEEIYGWLPEQSE